MNELIYVLTVEALVFGLLCVVLVAQRLDIFDWPVGRTWPVFSSCLLFVLAYVQLLQTLCCFIAVGRFGVLARGIMDACARTAGRLASTILLSLCYIVFLLWLHHQEVPEELPCLMNQLWGTQCGASGAVLWSFGVYLAVLLPAFAIFGGLQVTAAGMCKNRERPSCRALVCANCVYVLVHNVYYTWEINVEQGCHSACGVSPVVKTESTSTLDSTADENMVLNHDLLRLLIALAVCDICAEIALSMKKRTVVSVLVFCLIRIGELVAIPLFNEVAVRGKLPAEIVVTHFILTCMLCLFDITEAEPAVVLKFLKNRRSVHPLPLIEDEPSQANKASESMCLEVASGVKAFSVDNSRRRKFMLTFNGTSRWPTKLVVPSKKTY